MKQTLEQALESQRKDIEKETNAIKLQYKIYEIAGFMPLISSYEKDGKCVISFSEKHSEYDKDEKFSTWEDIYKIIAAIPPIKNRSLTFAGKDPQPTFSPFIVDFQNYEHGHNEVKIRYYSEFGDIWITFKPQLYNEDKIQRYLKKGKHKGFGRYERIAVFVHNWPHRIAYYGNTYSYYAPSEDLKEDFENAILNK
jgi:hypothetical protein